MNTDGIWWNLFKGFWGDDYFFLKFPTNQAFSIDRSVPRVQHMVALDVWRASCQRTREQLGWTERTGVCHKWQSPRNLDDLWWSSHILVSEYVMYRDVNDSAHKNNIHLGWAQPHQASWWPKKPRWRHRFHHGSLRPAIQYCWLTGKLLAWTVECFALRLSFLMFFEFMFWVTHSFPNSFVWFDVAWSMLGLKYPTHPQLIFILGGLAEWLLSFLTQAGK